MAINSYKSAGFYVYKIKKNKFIMLRNYFLNKIIIGTANFEDDYGIVAGKKITNKEKNKFFYYAINSIFQHMIYLMHII